MMLMAVALLTTSCSKKIKDNVSADAGSPSAGTASQVNIVPKVNATRSGLTQVSAHLSLDLSMGSQKVSVGGDMKMKRNSIIQISLQALGFITVGRLEFTPDYMMIMDNMNKRYVKVAYSEVPYLRDNGIDFYTFQALLWNELFIPGQKDGQPKASLFSQVKQGKQVSLSHQAQNLALTFLANEDGQLLQSQIKGVQGNKGMLCEYQGWGKINKTKSFPNKLNVNVSLGGQSVSTLMEISKLRSDDSWKGTPTTIDDRKFQQLTLQQVWSTVMNMAK